MYPVSVIIPTYNREKYLLRAINSVLDQEGFTGEIIVVDDGSTDQTGELVNSINHHIPIQYHYMSNKGPAGARNYGVKHSQYDFIAFLDSDDYWHKRKILTQFVNLHRNPGSSICHTEEKWLRRGEHLNKKKIHNPRHGNIFEHCLKICAVGMSTVLLTKELFSSTGGFDELLPCCEDYDFWLRVSINNDFVLSKKQLITKEGGRSDQLSYIYRVGMDKFRIYSIEKILSSYSLTNEQYNIALKELVRKCKVYGNGCIKHGKKNEGEKYLAIPSKYS